MDLGITGRVAMVFGAGGGLGGGIALALAREGALVAACDVNAEAVNETVRRGKEAGWAMAPVIAELGDHDSETAAVDDVVQQLGHISILVNNTGGPPPTTAASVPLETWRRHFESMVTSVFHLTDLVLPGMRERGWGRVVTSTSSGVVTPIPNLAISNSLRSALVGWSKTLAAEVARQGVTVNVVAPGRIGTQRTISIDAQRAEREGRSVEEVREESIAHIPVGRYGTTEEYGDVVAFLVSERASYITGSLIRIDGGLIPCV